MSTRFSQGLALAARAHDGQFRKGTAIPYIVHPVAVATLVAKFGGDEDQQIAALLHDVLEDGGANYEAEIGAFGERVLTIVRTCTDGVADATGQKAEWLPRKTNYLEHLSSAPHDALLVSACDKLANARDILEDLRNVGPGVFDRFSSTREQTLWYYAALTETFSARRVSPSVALAQALSEIVRELRMPR